MTIALSIPIVLSFLLIAAHFLRDSYFIMVFLSFIFPFLLMIRQRWVARVIQLALVCAAAEWVNVAISILNVRLAAGEPYFRMLFILGAVAAFNIGSAFIFYAPAMCTRYKLTDKLNKKEP